MNVFQSILLQGPPKENLCQILKSENLTNAIFVAESFHTPAVLESTKKEKAFALLKWLSSVIEHQSNGDDFSALYES